jgi:GntR family transcriptional regulator/MocR family aminotransferase
MLLILDGHGELNLQLFRALKRAVMDGRLAAGSPLPPTRTLATELGLSRNTVVAAYERLRAEHLAVARVGSGTFVASIDVPRRPGGAPRERIDTPSAYAARLRSLPLLPLPAGRAHLPIHLQYGEPLTHPGLYAAWARALAQAAVRTPPGYPPPQGLPELRTQIAAYLGRRRGVVCTADDIVVVNGTQQAFALLARVLLDEGDRVAIEEPGYALAKHCFMAHGARLVPVAVGAAGLDARCLPDGPLKLIAVTPSHQFPLGVSMTLPLRSALLEHAARVGAWIAEDDYDGEFGFEGRVLPALRSLDDGDRVIYVGSFSKTMLPSLRLGYIVCPRALRKDIVLSKRLVDVATPAIEQQALADFMAGGAFDRHLRRSAVELRRRRDALLDGLERHAAGRVVVQDSGAGMHLVARLPGYDARALQALIDAAAERGLGLYSLTPHFETPPAEQALLVGFASASVAQIRKATRLIGECLDHVGSQRAKATLLPGLRGRRAP